MKTFLFGSFLFIAHVVCADNYPRNSSINVLHYTFRFELNDTTNVISGEATVQLRVLKAITEFELDLVNQNSEKKGMLVTDVWVGDQKLKFSHTNNRLKILFSTPVKIDNTISVTIRYQGIPINGLYISKNKFGDRTFFGDNWPDRAHHWLPTIDHPYEKAGVDFIVTAPLHYTVIANGVKVEESYLNKKQKRTHWHEEIDLPTKVMVIGVARFAIQAAGSVGNIPVESWIYYQDRDPGFIDYAPATKILSFFQNQIGTYPYKKLANVQSTTIYGGMENASNIFYYEESVTGKGDVDNLLAHEIAHQWFGNSASENDWYHIWLSEGFATYFTQVYNEFTHGKVKAEEMRKAARQEVINFNKKNTGPVVNPTIAEYVKLLSPQVYNRGGWVLHMLRIEIGEKAFWDGIRTYYKTYQNSNASSSDFQRIMEQASGKKLEGFFQQWLYRAEIPAMTASWAMDKKGNSVVITVEQIQSGLPFDFPLEIRLVNEKGDLTVNTARISQKTQKLTFSVPSKIQKIILDPQTNLLFEEIVKN